MINQETKLPYAKFDHSETVIRQAQHVHTPGWRGAWLWCLKHFDYEAAEIIVKRNVVSDECDSGDHDLCNFAWCTCEHHSVNQFKLEHPQLRSFIEAQSEQGERDAA